MDHSAAYLALQRWVAGRSVVLLGAQGDAGARQLESGGAAEVLLVGGAEDRLPRVDGLPEIPLPDRSVDVVACLEPFGSLDGDARAQLIGEARRVLRRGGFVAVWIGPGAGVDFWAMEALLGGAFASVQVLAQIPWKGFSFAPILEDDAAAELVLEEGLLTEAPDATHYLAVAGPGPLPPEVARECVLVATESGAPQERPSLTERRLELTLQRAEEEVGRLRGALEAAEVARREGERELQARLHGEVDELRERTTALEERLREARARVQQLEDGAADSAALGEEAEELRRQIAAAADRERTLGAEAEELRGKLRARETDLTILASVSRDREQALERAADAGQQRLRELEEHVRVAEQLRRELQAAGAEREELQRQVDRAVSQADGERQAASRAEAALEQHRRKASATERDLAERAEEAARTAGELQGLRERLAAQEAALQQTQTRADELVASAAQGAAQGRLLTEVGLDRERLREELGRRTGEIAKLEERLWTAREELQQERIAAARTGAQVESLREQIERGRVGEEARATEAERLATELRALEVERAELRGALRSREQEVERLARDVEALMEGAGGSAELQSELTSRGKTIAALSVELEHARAREQDARELVARRDTQLDALGTQLRQARVEIEEGRAHALSLRAELEGKAVQLEQLGSRVASLVQDVEEGRQRLAHERARVGELQAQVEDHAVQQRTLRAGLRDADRALAEARQAEAREKEEVARLRRELEAALRQESRSPGDADTGSASEPTSGGEAAWPVEARATLGRLRVEVGALQRRLDAAQRPPAPATTADADAIRRLRLEVDLRAEEQEVLLGQLESAEQRIWEMTDASDRNAARLAAGLAQLERQREQLEEVIDELEVTRRLLSAAQARALEQERLLGAERAKLARAGLGPEGFPVSTNPTSMEDLFGPAAGPGLVDLASDERSPGARPDGPIPGTPVLVPPALGAGSGAGGPIGHGTGVVVEMLDEDEDSWVAHRVDRRKPPGSGGP